ncbi:MAG: hypothetical protein LBU73_03915 [Helicobacteraceae bacterium]|jgi:hypothetical protein|nr:hypothetical protein [Helicobacteraceae bacterium]
MKKTALGVMRLQPLHNGHRLLIARMLARRETAIAAIGSAGKIDERNIFSDDERREMIEAVFPAEIASGRLKILVIRDIGAKTKREWAEFVLAQIAARNLPAPNIYFAGSAEDASWFEGVLPLEIVDRKTLGGKINATEIRAALADGRDLSTLAIPAEIQNIIKRRGRQ